MAGLREAHWLTWANVLTSMRLLAAGPLYYTIVTSDWWIACVLFWFAVASDLFDGRVARASGVSSKFGGLFDHLTDAIFVIAGLLALSTFGQTPAVLPYLVAAAFLQYALDSKALAGQSLRTSSIGRWNGILYFVPVGVIVTRESVGLAIPADGLVLVVGWALVLSTLISISDRGWALIGSIRASGSSA